MNKPVSQNHVLVETHKDLVHAARELSRAGSLAIDTEFVSERTYFASLELLQITSSAGPVYLIDVPAVGDLASLAPLLADPERDLLFHAGSQDFALLRARVGPLGGRIFDCQVAAAMAGLGAQVSLSSLVKDLTGTSLCGKQTTSDWSARPFTLEQLRYASADVEHLHRLRDELVGRLERMKRLDWYADEQGRRLREYEEAEETPDSERYRRVKDWARLSGLEMAILRELAALRELEARERNVPRRQVMTDEGLIDIAQFQPSSREAVFKLRRVPQGCAARCADKIVAAVARGLEIPRSEWPARPTSQRLDVPTGIVEILQAVLRHVAETENIASGMLARTEDLNILASSRGDVEGLDLPLLRGWRRELIGERLLAVLDGRVHLRIAGRSRLEVVERAGGDNPS